MLNPFNFNWLGFEKFPLKPTSAFPQRTTRTRFHYWEGDAIVDEPILPLRTGWVQFKGTLWRARCDRDLKLVPGDRVRIVERRNLTLIVEPVPSQHLE